MTSRAPLHGTIAIFGMFAFAYLLSSLVRGVTATLAPVLTNEFRLSSAELGLLAGAYFLGFAVLQLPLGSWLDRYGPRKVLAASLSGAILSCVAFALAEGFHLLLVARFVGGMGVSACLIAPLTAARRWLPGEQQQGVNSWMLMAGAVGLLGATLPVQWLLNATGWRAIFFGLGLLFSLVLFGILLKIPDDRAAEDSQKRGLIAGYKPVFASRYLHRIAPIGFFNYATLVAVQTLWAGPWMTRVAGYSTGDAAAGLFAINLTMLAVFWFWGVINPKLHRRGFSSEQLMVLGLPLGVASLVLIAWLGGDAGWISFAVFCVCSSSLSLTHPAVGMAFPPSDAGKAIAAFNLLLFAGVFLTQWCVGILIDSLIAQGWETPDAYRFAFAILACLSAVSYLWFMTGNFRPAPPEIMTAKEPPSGTNP